METLQVVIQELAAATQTFFKRFWCLSRKLVNQDYVKERLILFLKKSSSEDT